MQILPLCYLPASRSYTCAQNGIDGVFLWSTSTFTNVHTNRYIGTYCNLHSVVVVVILWHSYIMLSYDVMKFLRHHLEWSSYSYSSEKELYNCLLTFYYFLWGCWWPGGKSDDYKAIAMGWQGLTSQEGSEEKESDIPLPSPNCPDWLLTDCVCVCV